MIHPFQTDVGIRSSSRKDVNIVQVVKPAVAIKVSSVVVYVVNAVHKLEHKCPVQL